jgi:hypothetical protein
MSCVFCFVLVINKITWSRTVLPVF